MLPGCYVNERRSLFGINTIPRTGQTGGVFNSSQIVGTAGEINVSVTSGVVTIGIVDPVAVAKGGTGLSTVAVGDLLYGTGVGVVSRLPLGLANRVLVSDGQPGNMAWTTLSLTTSVFTGLLPVAKGGTASSTAAGARSNLGLIIGTDVQAFDTQLSSVAGLVYAANALKVIRVNAGETAFELAASGTGTVTAVTATTPLLSTGGATPAISMGAINVYTLADLALDDELLGYDTSLADNVDFSIDKLGGFLDPSICNGRLTLTTGVPVTTSDVTAAGTIYFALYNGNRISLYDGTRWKLYTFTERSLSLTLTSGKNYDVFLYDNAGTLTLELSAAWTTDTARANALTTQDGVNVKSGATTRRYLGTIRASGTNTVEDSAGKRFVWNFNNQVRRSLLKQQPTSPATYTYGTNSWRSSNADSTLRVEIVIGIAGPLLDLRSQQTVITPSPTYGYTGLGEDTTTASSSTLSYRAGGGVGGDKGVLAHLIKYPAIGYHYYQQIEVAEAGTVTFVATSSDLRFASGLNGWTEG